MYLTSLLSKYEGKLPSPFNFFIEGHFHSILTLWSQPLVNDLFGDGYVWIIDQLHQQKNVFTRRASLQLSLVPQYEIQSVRKSPNLVTTTPPNCLDG